jgi:DNA (cytosine-5)-methyltransferase 1
MSAYYNENEPYAAEWLRNLIRKDLIAPGEVDERDIRDVCPSDLKGYTQHHFFAGIGVWSYALRQAGWPDDRPVWTGSCPCQPFSAAGAGAGFADERHLWPHWFHLIGECNPPAIFGEQSASKAGLGWLDLVQADMEAADYAFGTLDLCSAGFRAPHIRQRLHFVAERVGHPHRPGPQVRQLETVPGTRGWSKGGAVEQSGRSLLQGGKASEADSPWEDADWILCSDGHWRPVEPGTRPLADGAPCRVGKLRAYGNAITWPQATALIEGFMNHQIQQEIEFLRKEPAGRLRDLKHKLEHEAVRTPDENARLIAIARIMKDRRHSTH